MTLKTQITSDLPVFFDVDEFGENILYVDSNDVEHNIIAIVSRFENENEPYVRGNSTAQCSIEVKASDMPDPAYGQKFIFDNETWEYDPVIGVNKMTGNILSIHLEREL